MRAFAPHAWRFWYQWLILSPGLGYRLHRGGKFVPRIIVGASADKSVWDEETLRAFADNLAEPERARAGVQMYRVFNLREALPIARGSYARAAPHGARPCCSSAKTTSPSARSCSPATSATPTT